VALEQLLVNSPSRELVRLVHDVERLYLSELQLQAPQAPELALSRAISDCIEFYRVHDRERLFQIWRAMNGYRRKLAMAHLDDGAIRDVGTGRSGAEPTVGALLGVVPALAGAVLNLVPYRLSGLLGFFFAGGEPTRTAFARMMVGLVLFPATYVLYGWLIRRFAHWTWGLVLAGLAASALLGLFADVYFRWLRGERQHLRVEWLLRTHRRVIVRLRRERRLLVRLLDLAREDYLGWRGRTSEDARQA
jgi:hypothetical protein